MPAEKDKQAVIDRIGQLLAGSYGHKPPLRLTGTHFDDDWLYVVVEPTGTGERASAYAHLMTKIERTLQQDGYDQVLLVPAVPEHAGLLDVPVL